MKNKNKKGFTLIELLVVILIIGILAAVALPNYQRAKEKTIMSEGAQLAKQIAEANMRYYLVNNEYAKDIMDLDIDFSGDIVSYYDINRIQISNFIISSYGYGANENNPLISLAQEKSMIKYFIGIYSRKPNRITCTHYSNASQIQKELCIKLNADGHL